MLTYWFAKEDGRTPNLDHPAVVGETDTFEGELVPCQSGLHSCPTPWDALSYAPGPILYVVEIPDDAVPHGDPIDKYVAASRKYLFKIDTTKIMRCFAAQCALDVFDKWDPPDVVREYIEGTARGEDKSSIRASARVSARDAAAASVWDVAMASSAWASARAASARASSASARASAWDAQKTNFNYTIARELEKAGWNK